MRAHIARFYLLFPLWPTPGYQLNGQPANRFVVGVLTRGLRRYTKETA